MPQWWLPLVVCAVYGMTPPGHILMDLPSPSALWARRAVPNGSSCCSLVSPDATRDVVALGVVGGPLGKVSRAVPHDCLHTARTHVCPPQRQTLLCRAQNACAEHVRFRARAGPPVAPSRPVGPTEVKMKSSSPRPRREAGFAKVLFVCEGLFSEPFQSLGVLLLQRASRFLPCCAYKRPCRAPQAAQLRTPAHQPTQTTRPHPHQHTLAHLHLLPSFASHPPPPTCALVLMRPRAASACSRSRHSPSCTPRRRRWPPPCARHAATAHHVPMR